MDWRDDRVGSALRGENPLVMARMRSGFAVIGDTQFLPGYSLLLTDDPSADHLTDLDWPHRKQFLSDLVRNAPEHAYADEKHGQLRVAITAALEELSARRREH